MHYRILAAVAVAIASAISSSAAEWTSFSIGKITGYTTTFATLPDGRFILGSSGELFVQNAFGSSAKTSVAAGGVTFDPSFIAVKNSSSALIGAGGFVGPSGLYAFAPSTPSAGITSTALATLQNYTAVWWHHPSSGREGWLIGGANGTSNAHNVSFVSSDGTKAGAITGDLCTYSAGIAVDAAGNLYTSLYELDSSPSAADAEKVLKFTADQIDIAVAAVIAGTPAPVQRAVGSLVFKFDTASSIAVDSQNRIWAGGFKTSTLQCYDPATGLSRTFKPDHAAIADAGGPTTYQVQTFARSGVNYVAFLGTDLYSNAGTNIMFGYKAENDLPVRLASMAVSAQTVDESAGTVNVTVNLSSPATERLTVPFTVSGTATKGSDYSIATSSVVFNTGENSKTIEVKVIDDIIDEPNDAETVVIKLGTPAPSFEAAVAAVADTFTLTISDNDYKPLVSDTQNFGILKVGSQFNYQVLTTGGSATRFTVSGLPKGLVFDAVHGIISGKPTVPGEYAEVWITSTNAAGTSTSVGYVIQVDDFPAAAHGTFVGLTDRAGTSTAGLGARVDLTVASTAAFSGKVTIGRTSSAISGVLDTSTANPSGTADFAGKTLAFSIDKNTGALSGSITGGAQIVSGWRAESGASRLGLHNFYAAVPGGPGAAIPQGTSFGCAKVSDAGLVSVSGKAADGSAFSSSSRIGAGGEVLVYQALYAVPGSLVGTLSIAEDTAHTLAGDLSWSKPAQTTGALYRGGWSPVINLVANGGKYRPVSGSTIAMNVPESLTNNARLEFQDGGVEVVATNPTDIAFRLVASVAVKIAKPNTLFINNGTGAFNGSAKLGTKTVTYYGLIVPNTVTLDPFDGSGHGYFLLPTAVSGVSRSGMVVMEKSP